MIRLCRPPFFPKPQDLAFWLHGCLPDRRREAMPVTEDEATAHYISPEGTLRQLLILKEERPTPLFANIP